MLEKDKTGSTEILTVELRRGQNGDRPVPKSVRFTFRRMFL